jgi:hypothetical protein
MPPAHDMSHMGHDMPGMHDMGHMNHMGDFNAAELQLMNEASGTSMNPEVAPMGMQMQRWGSWTNMVMGTAFIVDTQQSGPRGGDKFYSANWLMDMLERRVGSGSLVFETMLSLEPATVTERRYPLLFQTGETAFGEPIVDGQHPHNFVMSLGVHYAHPLGESTIFETYVAPVGDPALGPVAYPHRDSARELPQAPLGHHWEDSTHIAFEVITVGVKHKWVRLEASGFHGAEPGENRWTIGYGAVDSWSTRLSVTPSPRWLGQFSVGRLTHPEALEPGDVVRTTASLSYSRPLPGGIWSSSLIWGRNHKTAEGSNSNAYLVETALPLSRNNTVTGRVELVDKDELFDDDLALKEQLAQTVGTTFRIQAYTMGYTRDFQLVRWMATGIGANISLYGVPAAIQQYYGDHPWGVNMFLRFRVRGARS